MEFQLFGEISDCVSLTSLVKQVEDDLKMVKVES